MLEVFYSFKCYVNLLRLKKIPGLIPNKEWLYQQISTEETLAFTCFVLDLIPHTTTTWKKLHSPHLRGLMAAMGDQSKKITRKLLNTKSERVNPAQWSSCTCA